MECHQVLGRIGVLTLALLVADLTGCGKPENEKKARPASADNPAAASDSAGGTGPAAPGNPQTTGRLLVKSNRANATIEVTHLPAAGEAAFAKLKGIVDKAFTGLPPGRYALVAKSDGWPEARDEATVEAGRTTETVLNFKGGSLRLDTVPAGAVVKQGSAILGKTPLVIPLLPPGECALFLEYPAWPALPFKTTITENGETAETVRLPHGKLTVESAPAGATVLQGKRTLGQTPVVLERVPAGTLKLTLQAKDFPPLEVSASVEDQGETKISPELGAGLPALDPPALLRAIWVPENKDRITESFDATGRFAPQNGIVKNLNRKKLHETWLTRRYRHTGVVKGFDAKTGQIEFAEDKSELARYRVLAKIGAASLDDPRLTPASLKGATLTLYGTLTAAEEPRWPAKSITFELTAAELLRGDKP